MYSYSRKCTVLFMIQDRSWLSNKLFATDPNILKQRFRFGVCVIGWEAVGVDRPISTQLLGGWGELLAE